jgi:phosphopentomutase
MVDRLKKKDERTSSDSSLKPVEETLPSYLEEKGKEYADVGAYKGVFTDSRGERTGAFRNKEKVDFEKKYQEKMKQAEKNAKMLRSKK